MRFSFVRAGGLAALLAIAPSTEAQVAAGAMQSVPGSANAPPAACVSSPGSRFGITSYQCSSCTLSHPADSAHVVYKFGSEPVVLDAQRGTRIQPGDVVVAVNGSPITTRAGADLFAYPPGNGFATLTVRRNGANIDIEQPLSSQTCAVISFPRSEMPAGGRGGRGGAGGGGGRGGVGGAMVSGSPTQPVGGRIGRSATPPPAQDSALRALQQRLCTSPAGTMQRDSGRTGVIGALDCSADSVRRMIAGFGSIGDTMASTIPMRNFGVTLECRPNCIRARARDGSSYWKFEGYPAIRGLVKDGIAAKAGLHDDDVIILVNDLSPLVEDGAMLLNRSDRELTLRLEISRAGKRDRVTLKL